MVKRGVKEGEILTKTKGIDADIKYNDYKLPGYIAQNYSERASSQGYVTLKQEGVM